MNLNYLPTFDRDRHHISPPNTKCIKSKNSIKLRRPSFIISHTLGPFLDAFIILEKMFAAERLQPLLALALASAVIAALSQGEGGRNLTFAQRRRGERKWAEDEEGRIFGRGSDGGEGTCTKRSAGIDAKLEYLNSKFKIFFLVCQSVVFGIIFGFKCWGIRCPVPRLTQKEEENSWSAHRRPISLPPPPPPDKNSTRPFVPHTWEIDLWPNAL